jgi:hypothetical protein
MNIRRFKKPMGMALTFVMFMALAGLPLPAAKERRGSMVRVTMTDGSTVRGELLAIKGNSLIVYDPNAGQGMGIILEQVAQVKVLKEPKFLSGLGLGLILGLGYCFHHCEILGHNEDYERMIYMYLPPAGALLGGIIGVHAGLTAYYDFDSTTPLSVQKNLQRLKRYARESDTDSGSVPDASQRRKFFSRLRFLWSPALLVPSGSISSGDSNGTFRFVEPGSSKDIGVYKFEPFNNKEYKEYKNSQRFRLEYKWTSHLTTGLEYLSVVESENWYSYNLTFASIDFNMNYHLGWSGGFFYTYDSLLLGLNWKPLSTSSSRKEVIELGIAAGPTRVSEKIHSPMREVAQSTIMTWMAKIHFAYDHFYNDNLSFGGFIEFQYLPTQFAGVTYIEPLDLGPEGVYDHEYQIKRSTEIMIPDHKTQLGGLAYGLRLGLRF